MSAISPPDQNTEDFKEYLDKTGVLEFLSTNVLQNKKNQEFKELLDKAGVPEFLDLVLSKLYEEPDKPSDALEYIKKSIGGAKAHKEEIAKLSYENADLKKKIEELEKKEAELQLRFFLKEKLMDAADAFSCNDLSSVEPGSLAKTVSKMEKCYLSGSKLTTPQLEAIFKQLNEGCKLKELDVSWNNLSEVEGDDLSKAIANLVEVSLSWAQLTTQQLEALFMEIKRSRRKLKILKLYGTNLRSVKIDNLVGALGCLDVVHLHRDWLTPEQWDAVKGIPGLRYRLDYVTVD